MIRTALFLPEPLLKALRALAKRTDLPIAEHVRRAIEQYLQQLDKK
jgi:predicted DNA-binding protein